MGNRVEERLDVEVEHPVVSPASLTRRAHGINRRAAWSVTVGVRMEHRVQARLQIPADNLLRDSIRQRWDTQRPRPAPRLRNVHPPHRLGEIASRGQSVPELVEIVLEINLKVCDRLPVYSSRSLVGLHLLEGLPDFPLRDVKRLCLGHVAPPVAGWPPVLGGLPQSLRSSPVTGLSSLLRTAPSLCSTSVLLPLQGSPT